MSLSRSSMSTRRSNGPIGGGARRRGSHGDSEQKLLEAFPIEMLEVAGDRHEAARRTPLALAKREHLVVGEALDVSSVAGGARREAVAVEERRRHPVVGARSRVLVGVGDLPEDHRALHLQMRFVEQCPPAYVGQQVDRRHRRLGSDDGTRTPSSHASQPRRARCPDVRQLCSAPWRWDGSRTP